MTDFLNKNDQPFHSMVRGRCPYLAVPIDRETWFKTPSAENYCHKAKPPQPIRISHQQLRCLGEYTLCPVYRYEKENWKGQLPRQIQGRLPDYIEPKRPPLMLWLAIAAVIIAIIVIIIMIVNNNADMTIPEAALRLYLA